MKTVIIVLITFACSFAGLFESPVNSSNSELTKMAQTIGKQKIVRVTFVQTKEMKALKKPLVAHGTLVFAKGRGILWNQKTPYEELIAIKPNGSVRVVDQSGVEIVQNSKAGDRVNAMMTTLFAGNIAELQKQFDLFFVAESNQWKLGMIPKKDSMKKGLSKMSMTCSNSGIMKEIIMVGSGGTTTISFAPQVSQTLTSSEEKQLDHP